MWFLAKESTQITLTTDASGQCGCGGAVVAVVRSQYAANDRLMHLLRLLFFLEVHNFNLVAGLLNLSWLGSSGSGICA